MSSTVRPFELAVYCEVFGASLPVDFAIVSEWPGRAVPMAGGMCLTPTEGLDRLAAADLVAVAPPGSPARAVSPAVADALRAVVDRGARVAGSCSAVFTMAAAGLLDGRTVATDPRHAPLLTGWFPRVRVDTAMRFVADDPIFTAAGTAAGIDLCLHLVRTGHGEVAAEAVARGMVLGPQPVTPPPGPRRDDGIDRLLDWALGNLHENLSIEVLARRAFLSRRSFARRFRQATGTSPYAWILEQRVRLAQRLLEQDPRLAVEVAAGRAGFSSAALLRQHFQRRFGCSPTQYRSRFALSSRE
jgi:transcriptional regulator GlxA family with amidase domain